MALNEFFLLIFKFLCITAAGFMIGYWILIFYTNKDLTLIDYKAIEDVKDLIYPQPSICFVTPFINNQLLNVSDNERYNHPYLRFLEGDGNYELYKSINYSQVTPNLGNYFKWLMFFWKPGKSQIKTYCSNIRECPYLKFKNHYNGFWSTYFMKCFSIEIDSEYIRDIRQFYVAFNSEFRNVLNQVLQTVVFFFHPNQFLRPREEPKFIWRKEDNFSNSEMFQITSLELLKRRNKHNGKCLSDWNEYDDLVLKLFLKSVSCKPPYIKENSTNLCETEDSFQKARYNGWNFAKKNAILYPCQEMSLISYKHDFYPNGDETRDLHLFSVSYPPTIKIIKQSQAVDVHSLIGNIGGYIGLFLGYAIIQLPELIASLHGYIKQRYSEVSMNQISSFSSTMTRKEFEQIKRKKVQSPTSRQNHSDGSLIENTEACPDRQIEIKYGIVMNRIDHLELQLNQQINELKKEFRNPMK